MKNVIKLFLLVGLVLSSNAAMAKDGNYAGWSPGDVHVEAVAACKSDQVLFSDDANACQAALNQCVVEFKECVHTCEYYTGMFQGDEDARFYTCTDGQIAVCQAFAEADYNKAISEGGACQLHFNEKPKLDLAKAKKPQLQPLDDIGIEAVPLDPGSLPEVPQQDPEQPTPETPDSGASTPVTDSGAGKSEVQQVPTGVAPVSSIAGSGCTLQALASVEGGMQGLIYALIATLPILATAFKRK